MTKPFVSVCKPLEIELDGVKYPLRKLNRLCFREVLAFQKRISEASNTEKIDLIYDHIASIVDAPADIIDNIDARQMSAVIKQLTSLISGKA